MFLLTLVELLQLQLKSGYPSKRKKCLTRVILKSAIWRAGLVPIIIEFEDSWPVGSGNIDKVPLPDEGM